jgi:hypothetical protein
VGAAILDPKNIYQNIDIYLSWHLLKKNYQNIEIYTEAGTFSKEYLSKHR